MMEEIYLHASKEAPRECCGLVIQDGNNEKYIPLENISPKEDEFAMDGKTFLSYQLNSKIKLDKVSKVYNYSNQNDFKKK